MAPSKRWLVESELDQKKQAFDGSREALLSLGAFLKSGVAEYFATLFGATYLMDGARMEKGDIGMLPCPFTSVDDPAFLALHELSDIDEAILDAMSAGQDLRHAVREFASFNKNYIDAQLPLNTFEIVDSSTVDLFLNRLQRELGGSFTQRFTPSIKMGRRKVEASRFMSALVDRRI